MFGVHEQYGGSRVVYPVAGREEIRERIAKLKAVMLALPQVDCPVEHYFTPGIYTRVLTIKAGVFLLGETHRAEHLNVVAKGDISVLTEDGVRRLRAGDVFAAGPGVQKVGFAHEDTIWINVHHNPSNTKDMDALEAMYIQPSENAVLDAEAINILTMVEA
jgi:hypothetical protein